jgi:hypothetical protein
VRDHRRSRGCGRKIIRLGFEENRKRYVVTGGGSCGPLGGKEKVRYGKFDAV